MRAASRKDTGLSRKADEALKKEQSGYFAGFTGPKKTSSNETRAKATPALLKPITKDAKVQKPRQNETPTVLKAITRNTIDREEKEKEFLRKCEKAINQMEIDNLFTTPDGSVSTFKTRDADVEELQEHDFAMSDTEVVKSKQEIKEEKDLVKQQKRKAATLRKEQQDVIDQQHARKQKKREDEAARHQEVGEAWKSYKKSENFLWKWWNYKKT